MRIEKYPRIGEPLAPSILAAFLNVPAGLPGSSAQTQLADLDANSWSKYGDYLCRQLADRVVHQVARHVSRLPESLRALTLGTIANGASLELITVSLRTFNCLGKAVRAGKDRRKLSNVTIGDLVKTNAFGAKCLVDLLAALEAIRPVTPSNDQASKGELDSELTAAASELMNNQFAEFIRCDDPRGSSHLLGLRSIVRSLGYLSWEDTTAWELAERLASRKKDPLDVPSVINELKSVQAFILKTVAAPLEKELLELVGTITSSGRNAEIVVRYFGFDGRGVQTLQQVGDEYALSRERVRQICEQTIRRASSIQPFAPKLRMAIDFLKHCRASSERVAEMGLVAKRITEKPFRISGLFKAAELCSIAAESTFEQFQAALLSGRSGEETKERIRRIARKTVCFWGVTRSAIVQDKVREKWDCELSLEMVERTLSDQPDCVWLDKEQGWFWLRNAPKNPLVTKVRKVMAVCDRLDISELRLAVSRDRRINGFAPPRRVLLSFCSHLSFCNVTGNEVTRRGSVEISTVLSEAEYRVHSLLVAKGPLVSSIDLESAWAERGLNRNTLFAVMSHSPVIERFAPCIYGIRGVSFSPGLLAQMKARSRVAHVTNDYGWTSDGKPWITYRLSRGMLNSGVLNIPAAMKRYIIGRFRYLSPEDGSDAGAIVADENRAWGLGPFLRHHAPDVGDCMMITFDLTRHRAEIRVGDIETPSVIVSNAGSHPPKAEELQFGLAHLDIISQPHS